MSTGAPGEHTCADAVAGCHSDAMLTDDVKNTVNTLLFSSPDSTYKTGNKYTLTLKVAKPGIERFGFEIVALGKTNNINMGTWSITNSTRTQIISGTGSLSKRKYVTHKSAGTTPVSSGLGQWSFDWTAPSVLEGEIVFYYISNCANNDGKVTGDNLFKSSFPIRPEGWVSITDLTDKSKFNVSYHPENRSINLQFSLLRKISASFAVYDINGKIISAKEAQNREPGFYSENINLESGTPSGIYLVNLVIGDQNLTQKVIIP